MERAPGLIVQLYHSATPFHSCEYAGERSCTMPCLSKSINMAALTYSPQLSVLNRLMVALSCLYRAYMKLVNTLMVSDLA